MNEMTLAKELVRVAKELVGDASVFGEVRDAYIDGARVFGKEAKIRGMGIEGPIRTITGVNMNLWLGRDRYSSNVQVLIKLFDIPAGQFVEISGHMDGKNVKIRQDIVPILGRSIELNDVVTAIKQAGRKIGVWTR